MKQQIKNQKIQKKSEKRVAAYREKTYFQAGSSNWYDFVLVSEFPTQREINRIYARKNGENIEYITRGMQSPDTILLTDFPTHLDLTDLQAAKSSILKIASKRGHISSNSQAVTYEFFSKEDINKIVDDVFSKANVDKILLAEWLNDFMEKWTPFFPQIRYRNDKTDGWFALPFWLLCLFIFVACQFPIAVTAGFIVIGAIVHVILIKKWEGYSTP